jgi:hypothetical protein
VSNSPIRTSNRAKLLGLLAFAAIFLIVLAGLAFWLIRSMTARPNQIVFLPPEAVQESRIATAPPPGQATVRTAPAGSRPTFKGKVIDAQTNQPISAFTVHIGYSFSGNRQPPYFNAAQPKVFHGGQYNITSPFNIGSAGQWLLRIDARGYLPVVSAPQSASGNLDFALQPGKDIQGIVLDSTGAPAPGVTVVLAVPGLNANLNLENPAAKNPDTSFSTTTDADGKFDLPPQSGQIAIAALNDTDFAQITLDASTPNLQLHLAPFGHIHGHLTVAGKPGANQSLSIYDVSDAGPMAPRIDSTVMTKTDADGNFTFDRVVPGDTQISRQVRRNVGANGWMMRFTGSETFLIKAGQSLTVHLGGVGRAVVGKLIFPPGMTIKDFNINDNISGTIVPPPTTWPAQMPDNVKNGPQMARDVWMQFFTLTAAGRDFVAAHPPPRPITRQYAMEIANDGSFRIEDVVPGDYYMNLYPNMMRAGRPMIPYNTSFTVPPVPGGGYSDQSVNLGEIQFKTR